MSKIDGTSVLLSLAIASAIGCGTETTSPLPKLRYEGEHIRVGTDFEVPICGGNLYDFDREIERIEARLELGAVGKTDMWILADGNLYELYCASHTRGCEAWDSAGGVLVRRRAPDVLWHAIAHDRVNRADRERLSASKGLFVEGLAEGLARAYCEPPIPLEFEGPSADALLAAGAEHPDFTFLDVSIAGQLMRWLIATHGPQAVQEFMVAIDNDDHPDAVRAAYAAHFGGSIDDDLYAHLDWDVGNRHPFELGCRGQAPPVDESGNVHTLQATLECSSELVRSNFYEHRPDRIGYGYVEWALAVATPGYHAVAGELPPNTELTIARCDCESLGAPYWDGPDPTIARPFSGENLSPGLYRLVWKGPLDSEHTLDVKVIRS